MMKAIVKEKPLPGLTLTEVEIPTISPNDLLIKVKKVSLCGTDKHLYEYDAWAQKTIKIPLTIGHEFVGEVVEVGGHVTGYKIGDRVAGEGHITCGTCRNCRTGKEHLCLRVEGLGYTSFNGCFAEYVTIPAKNAFFIPPTISDEIAAIMDPFGNAVHTVLEFDLTGEDVLITGAGPIGIMAVAIAKHVGARRVVITDVNPYRLDLAKKMGATHCVNVAKTPLKEFMQTFEAVEGFDVALEVSGHPAALSDIVDLIRPGCPVALLGILPENAPIDWHKVIFKGLTLQGIYGRKMFQTWYKMIGLLQGGLDISPIITHRIKPEQFEEAFKVMKSGECGKIVMDFE